MQKIQKYKEKVLKLFRTMRNTNIYLIGVPLFFYSALLINSCSTEMAKKRKGEKPKISKTKQTTKQLKITEKYIPKESADSLNYKEIDREDDEDNNQKKYFENKNTKNNIQPLRKINIKDNTQIEPKFKSYNNTSVHRPISNYSHLIDNTKSSNIKPKLITKKENVYKTKIPQKSIINYRGIDNKLFMSKIKVNANKRSKSNKYIKNPKIKSSAINDGVKTKKQNLHIETIDREKKQNYNDIPISLKGYIELDSPISLYSSDNEDGYSSINNELLYPIKKPKLTNLSRSQVKRNLKNLSVQIPNIKITHSNRSESCLSDNHINLKSSNDDVPTTVSENYNTNEEELNLLSERLSVANQTMERDILKLLRDFINNDTVSYTIKNQPENICFKKRDIKELHNNIKAIPIEELLNENKINKYYCTNENKAKITVLLDYNSKKCSVVINFKKIIDSQNEESYKWDYNILDNGMIILLKSIKKKSI